ncbi:hypothetical protein VISI1226_07388 [Vibrio sinaloensis DSM 21326]|uniref:Uncharacterized protein n=1 Tax=Vibrio sinaloensis DSM 21326 TaxID=945550 RepID=E8MAG2_PHOS4|nr:hypothetical protein [Vibrio sinaloensis]EGA69111.1 hypothetical protein VISI1226_07388 [Vibrio sinaloensis DSM 21326]
MNALILSALLLTVPSVSVDSDSLPLKCTLLDSADNFWFYHDQLVFHSNQFALFQNFKGRTVTQVDLKTNELIRTTYIGDRYNPKYQILLGRCEQAAHTLDIWELSQTPYDN